MNRGQAGSWGWCGTCGNTTDDGADLCEVCARHLDGGLHAERCRACLGTGYIQQGGDPDDIQDCFFCEGAGYMEDGI